MAHNATTIPLKSPSPGDQVISAFFLSGLIGIPRGLGVFRFLRRDKSKDWKWRTNEESVHRRVREGYGDQESRDSDLRYMVRKGWTVGEAARTVAAASPTADSAHPPPLGVGPFAPSTRIVSPAPTIQSRAVEISTPRYTRFPQEPAVRPPPPVYTANPRKGETVIIGRRG